MFAMEQHKNYVHNQNIINTSFTLTCILTLRLTFYVEKIYNSVSKKKSAKPKHEYYASSNIRIK